MIQKGTYTIQLRHFGKSKTLDFKGHFYTEVANNKKHRYFYDGALFMCAKENEGVNISVQEMAKYELKKLYGQID